MHVFLQLLVAGLSIGAVYALIALGYTMVYGALRLINFAHGDIYMVGAVIGYYLATWLYQKNVPRALIYPIMFIGAIIGCAALGYLIERLCYRPLRSRPKIVSLITAIGVSLLLENLFQGLRDFRSQSAALSPALRDLGEFHILGTAMSISTIDAITLSLCLAVMAALTFLVLGTRTGLAMRAISFRADTASLMGVNVNRVISVTFMLGSALAAVAGVVNAMNLHYSVYPLMGLTAGIKAFVAAVLGGIGSIPGALLGGLLMGLVETFLKGYLPGNHTGYADAAAYAILILVLVIRPAGLLGKLEPEKV